MSKDGVHPRFNPLLPNLTRWVLKHDVVLVAMTWATMVLELVLVPAVLFVPGREHRAAVSALCMLFHFGIWLTFSSTAGTMFFQLSGVYALGFCGELAAGGWPMVIGAVAALSPLLRLLVRGDPFVSGERWPITNCALFPWSDQQIAYMHRHFIDGDTRLVLVAGSSDAGGGDGVTEADLLGREVTMRGQDSRPLGGITLHHVKGNLWNWTKVYPEFAAALNDAVRNGRQPVSIVAPIRAWLTVRKDRRPFRPFRPFRWWSGHRSDPVALSQLAARRRSPARVPVILYYHSDPSPSPPSLSFLSFCFPFFLPGYAAGHPADRSAYWEAVDHGTAASTCWHHNNSNTFHGISWNFMEFHAGFLAIMSRPPTARRARLLGPAVACPTFTSCLGCLISDFFALAW